MAVAVLERNAEILENSEITQKVQLNKVYPAISVADERHNAQISENYAKLINPNAKIEEVLGRTQEVAAPAPRDIFAKPYLVENARADAAIFRADSPVNRIVTVQPQAVAEDVEEENEDLRPTPTTIQYKTNGVKKTVEEGKIESTGAEKRAGLSKKEKIIIGVIVGVIVAMFALIIINSAILSGINADSSSLQSSLATVKGTYAGISDEINSYMENVLKDVADFAFANGMVKLP